ncbi:MAG: HAD family hydrolase [Candidatus Limnocylindrales bacterium]
MIDGLRAITFDFGNTLVQFPAATMTDVVRLTAARTSSRAGFRVEEFARVWGEERLRQFADDVPAGREADMDVRVVRVLARLRGCSVPDPGARWDDVKAAGFSEPREVTAILETYATVFVETTPVPSGVGPMLERLARHCSVGILSNWPLALAIDRYLEAAGWSRHLSAVVISQRVGWVKPRPEIFEVAAREFGVAAGPSILHVGDDLGADVVGAQRVGWRAAWVRMKPEDSPLPTAPPAPGASPDLIVDSVMDLEAAIGLPGSAANP